MGVTSILSDASLPGDTVETENQTCIYIDVRVRNRRRVIAAAVDRHVSERTDRMAESCVPIYFERRK